MGLLSAVFLLVLIFLGSQLSHSAEIKSESTNSTKKEFRFKSEIESRWAAHTQGDHRISANKYDFTISQDFKMDNLYAIFTGKGIVDGGPAQNSNYSNNFVRRQTSEFQLRDTYVQYKNNNLKFKLGFQQVVWGETFGSFYADIVNPKDVRDLAPDDLQRVRIPMLLGLGEYFFSDGSVQLVYSPQPKFNKMPDLEGDFSPFKSIQSSTTIPIEIADDKAPNNKSEAGLRINKLFGNTDISIFHFNYFDRMPTYSMSYTLNNFIPTLITLTPEHQNISTSGATLTHDFEVLLLRLESVHTPRRYINGYINNQLTTKRATQNITVIEVGFPTLELFHLTIQYAMDTLKYSEETTPVNELQMNRRNNLETFSINISKTFSNDSNFDFILTNMGYDGSKLLRSKLMIPLSTRMEFNLGYDAFLGDKTDYFGQYRDSSRAWTGFHGYF